MFELWFGCFGNGTMVCNKAVKENGDYKEVAHISEHGVIKFYVDESYIPKDAVRRIRETAQREKEEFLKMWNKKDYIDKWEYMMEIQTIGCGYNPMEEVNWLNRGKTMEQRVALMEEVFFKTHM
jgi:hypothetical protein